MIRSDPILVLDGYAHSDVGRVTILTERMNG